MADTLPELTLGLDDGNKPIVLVGDDEEAASLAALLARVPALAGNALELARVVNHFAHGVEYDVIEDPAAFAAAYRARLAAEDPAAEWRENVRRLSDFGMPDFTAIRAPRIEGGRLLFHAVDGFLGVPYEVTASVGAGKVGEAAYEPVDLTPA
jgi:hypothetical protein